MLQRTDIDRFRAAISRRLGFRVDDSRIEETADLLQRRVRESRAGSVEQYLAMFETSREELRAVASRVTVGETYFFRIPEHYRVLVEVGIPERMQAQAARRQLAILSAGCSSGEEAYSAAIVLRETLSEMDSWRATIQGVDINADMIARARQACYSEWSFRQTPANVRERYFHRNGKALQLAGAVRELVTFQEGNLLDANAPFWRREAYDIVFLRNVLMYFGPEAAEAVVARVTDCLAPDGFLFLGPAETLRGLSTAFHLCHTHDVFYYQRRGSSPARQPARRIANANDLPKPAMPAALPDVDISWFDAIQRASERIHALAQAPPRTRTTKTQAAAAGRAPRPRAHGDIRIALELLREERFADALEALHALPSDSREDPDVQLLRAVLLANGGAIAEAEKACESLLAGDDLNAGAHYLKALCREHAGDDAGAAEHDRIAVYLDAAFAMPHLHLGLLAKRAAEFDEACRELRQAAALLSVEDSSRVLLFGGGFSREVLIEMCRRELIACRGAA